MPSAVSPCRIRKFTYASAVVAIVFCFSPALMTVSAVVVLGVSGLGRGGTKGGGWVINAFQMFVDKTKAHPDFAYHR